MKKIIISFWVSIISVTGFSQDPITHQPCSYKQETKEYIKAIDNLSNYFYSLKNSIGEQEWNEFISDVNSGRELSSFNKCGINYLDFQNQYVAIYSDIEMKAKQLIKAIDPSGNMPRDNFDYEVLREVNCYLTDTVENNLEQRFSIYGRLAPGSIGTLSGPCERELRTCADNAENAFFQNLAACAGIGATVGTVGSPLVGAGVGLLCAAGAAIRKNRADWTCVTNYFDCKNDR